MENIKAPHYKAKLLGPRAVRIPADGHEGKGFVSQTQRDLITRIKPRLAANMLKFTYNPDNLPLKAEKRPKRKRF